MVTGVSIESVPLSDRMDRLRSAARSRAKPEPKLEGEWWLRFSRKAQRKRAQASGHGTCHWVGGRLYRADGQEVLGAPRLPKLDDDGKLKQAVGMKGGQPGSRGPRPPSYLRDRHRREEREQGGLSFRID